ncbi:glycosyl hydrolase [Sulfurimonas sp. HSL1-2]|uniref:glycosyl hydrolase n=1 Tax=Thiomicrolovo zhangzhouensis TaxID=3131933 RepID=UPI0031F72FF8
MKPPYAWDFHSDQPYQLKDRALKRRLRKAQRASLVKTALSGLLWLPLALLAMPFLRRRPVEASRFTGLIIDPLREPEATLGAVTELDVNELLIRVKLWEPDALEKITAFARNLEGRRLLFVLMQDREHIEDAALRRRSLERTFAALAPFGDRFQIGTTINRAKWGFASVNEYLEFFKTAQQLRDERYPELKLIGPGVIDFEYHFAAHAFFNLRGIRFDAVAALLYVDRRGAPENTQTGCDLPCKINFLSSLVMLSPRAKYPLYLTETNWPLSGTAPYAPTSEKECVDGETYASYMVRYYLLALATQQVATVYWHQLAAPGYGLVDTREGWHKRPGFKAFKTMASLLKEARHIALQQRRDRFEMLLQRPEGLLRIFWTNGTEYTQHFAEPRHFIGRDGNTFTTDALTVSGSPVYLIEKDEA